MSGGMIASARIGLTGACASARRLTNVEQALAGSQASEQTLAAAARLAADDLEHVNADVHASADYRRAMVAVFARRALVAALARA
jgi:aerobic carbon-monoxide dehydrogenase medium subunit